MKTVIAVLLLTATAFSAFWETLKTKGQPDPRHEAAFVEYEGEFYLLGGRRIQPVVYEDKILIICAMTGKYPRETGLEKVLIYEPKKDMWSWGDEIPENRRCGAAGVVNVAGKIYVIGGIVRGHLGGYVDWADLYDPKTGDWTKLKSAKDERDHFQAAYLEGKIYAACGRTTSRETGKVFELTVPEVDVYDIQTGKWSVLKDDLPTPRAGNSAAAIGMDIVVAGGESGESKQAHDEVEA
jgi:N-acetylneuraminic acid mutarotase